MKQTESRAYFVVILGLIIAIGWAFSAGVDQHSLLGTWQTVLHDHHSVYYQTLMTIRLPRIVAALVSGAALSVAGTFFQAALRNSIADPSILGISAGADLAILIGGFLLPKMVLTNLLAAVVGGVISLGLLMGFRGQSNPYKLILIGVALNTMFVGLKTLFIKPATVVAGQSFATITWAQTLVLLVSGVLGLVAALVIAPWANYLKIGDRQLATIGLPVRQLQGSLLLVAVYLTSTVTAYAGVIPFIGIIVPHLSRWWVGHDYRELVPFATLLGALLLLVIDTLGRTLIMPNEIAAATLLAVIGGPALILILAKKGIYNGN
ncbi:iron ABC transporter permease [Lacticaseibacillus baoqingensis]|uniref:Probable heme-iron transport system permease protein IsdF n=1 Tax=Lacticaseibacillus baoqingensis TaxID=2486013 RepID=A0ABW4E3G3_9LACO|nr:iron ABC transporter permease [Lacticaseibacillus baoqingensis]